MKTGKKFLLRNLVGRVANLRYGPCSRQVGNLPHGLHDASGPRRRRGFTLVEVLTVITIIGILMGVLLPAVQMARRAAKRARIKQEMGQLQIAIENFRTQIGGGEYPPDGSDGDDVKRFFRRNFQRCPAANYPDTSKLTPDTALVFWLGGTQDANGNFIGFSANAQNPGDSGAARLQGGAMFDFDKTRLKGKQYFPQNDKLLDETPNPAPYVYFKAVGGNYKGTACGAKPFKDSSVGSTTHPWVNASGYQLLCPGLDGQYASGSGQTTDGKEPLYPAGTNYSQAMQDDMTNFTNGATVGDDTQ